MKNIREIIKYSEAIKSHREIARITGVSRPTVAEYIRSFYSSSLTIEQVNKLSDSELLSKLSVRAPSPENDRLLRLTGNFTEYIRRLKQVGMTLQILWEEYTAQDPEPYSYSRFCEIFQEHRKEESVTMHIEHKYGDRAFFDFTGKKLRVYDRETGEEREVEVFVGILGASQLTYVEAVESQKIPDVIVATEKAFHYFGGTPNAAVFDCLKSVITKGDKYEPITNTKFDHFLDHYGTINLPARPLHPRDKALVEGVVRIIYTRIYTKLQDQTFFSLKELNKEIRLQLEDHNNTPLTNMGLSRRELFEQNEKETLHSLPKIHYEIPDFAFATVQINYHVYFGQDKHYYSVPFNLRRKKVKIVAGANAVEIHHDGQRVATHLRKRSFGYSTTADHMPSHHRFLAEMNPERLMKRAADKSPVIADFVAAILRKKPYPEQGYKSALGVIDLTKKYPVERVVKACERAMYYDSINYQSIKEILNKQLDAVTDYKETDLPGLTGEHENLRGSEYYEGVSL